MTALRDACKVAVGANLLLFAGCLRLWLLGIQPDAAANLACLALAAGSLCAVGAWGNNSNQGETK